MRAVLKFRKRKENQSSRHAFTFSIKLSIWSFYGVVLQRKAKKCTDVYNARSKFFLIKTIVCLAFSLTSSSSVLKLPINR